ncbi:hypothetical protein IF2G_11054 [Cordyceps javanica]|nr:hypothetical protein IF2G_11054 [Cordyceps javanica]
MGLQEAKMSFWTCKVAELASPNWLFTGRNQLLVWFGLVWLPIFSAFSQSIPASHQRKSAHHSRLFVPVHAGHICSRKQMLMKREEDPQLGRSA